MKKFLLPFILSFAFILMASNVTPTMDIASDNEEDTGPMSGESAKG